MTDDTIANGVAIEGATVIGSLTYPVDAEGLKALHGKEIVATGYVTGYVSNKYMNVIFTEVKEFTYTVSFKFNRAFWSTSINSRITP